MQIVECKVKDVIIIDQHIVITIIEIKPSRVKLGVQTPKGINAHRKEVHKRIQKERKGKKD